MVHRDELSAARARIEALERELADALERGLDADAEADSRNRERLRELRARTRELEELVRVSDQRFEAMREAKYAVEEQVAELERQLAAARKNIDRERAAKQRAEAKAEALGASRASTAPRPRPPKLSTLRAHNEYCGALVPGDESRPAGVRCSSCARDKRTAELLVVRSMSVETGFAVTVCPNCGNLAAMFGAPS